MVRVTGIGPLYSKNDWDWATMLEGMEGDIYGLWCEFELVEGVVS